MLHVVATEGIVAADHLGFTDRENITGTLRQALQRIDPANSQVGAAVRQGDPANEILQIARSLPIDLIVMGATEVERSERPIGSITAIVVARSAQEIQEGIYDAACRVWIVADQRVPIQGRDCRGSFNGRSGESSETQRDGYRCEPNQCLEH